MTFDAFLSSAEVGFSCVSFLFVWGGGGDVALSVLKNPFQEVGNVSYSRS